MAWAFSFPRDHLSKLHPGEGCRISVGDERKPVHLSVPQMRKGRGEPFTFLSVILGIREGSEHTAGHMHRASLRRLCTVLQGMCVCVCVCVCVCEKVTISSKMLGTVKRTHQLRVWRLKQKLFD